MMRCNRPMSYYSRCGYRGAASGAWFKFSRIYRRLLLVLLNSYYLQMASIYNQLDNLPLMPTLLEPKKPATATLIPALMKMIRGA